MGLREFNSVKKLLESLGIHYEVTEHGPVYTSEEAAKVRGVELKTGVKALVLKTENGNMLLGLIAADRKIDLKKLAKAIGAKKLQLASPEEVLKATGCEVGSVHPFGNLFGLKTYLDSSVMENDLVNFNAGLHTFSIHMKARDLLKAIKPEISEFSQYQKA
jgi:Ala-tRNA(Pro) deacylase